MAVSLDWDLGPWVSVRKDIKCGMCSKDRCSPELQMKMIMQDSTECSGWVQTKIDIRDEWEIKPNE